MRLIKNPWIGEPGYNCFGCCPDNPFGLKMNFYEEEDDVVCLWQPSVRFQSWENTLHGGVQSVLLDEICGWVVFHKLQASGVTAKMETRFRKPVAIREKYIELRARLKEKRRNIAIVEGEIRSAEGEVLVECSCTYFTFDAAHAPEQVPYNPTELIGEELTRDEVLISLGVQRRLGEGQILNS
jgi:acyl-coenzyme A thioesterase PaaI-like protein